MTIHCDSQSTIHLVDNHIYHKRMEYIYIRLHFMGDVIEFGKVKIKKIVLEMNPHMCLRSPCQR